MEELDYWRLCESLTLHEAAALIVGSTPSSVRDDYLVAKSVDEMDDYSNFLSFVDEAPSIVRRLRDGDFLSRMNPHFQGVLSALKSAIESGRLKPDEPPIFSNKDNHLRPQRVKVEDLRNWLASKGINTGFFFPGRKENLADYLDSNHACYAPKLAAAVRAWEAVTSDPVRLRGKTPKQALKKWLNENAAAYDLATDDGTPNSTGVEEAAKLANWKPEGGASKTPSE